MYICFERWAWGRLEHDPRCRLWDFGRMKACMVPGPYLDGTKHRTLGALAEASPATPAILKQKDATIVDGKTLMEAEAYCDIPKKGKRGRGNI